MRPRRREDRDEADAAGVVSDDDYAVVLKLRKDLAAAAAMMSDREARYLVDLYYQVQGQRLAIAGQVRSMAGEPTAMLSFLAEQAETLEQQCRKALDLWTEKHVPSAWARSIPGIGPVLAAGLRAYTKIDHCPTVGHLWAFFGLDPTKTWEKGQKRPWNADAKKLAYLIGESFVKVKSRPTDIYGKLYTQRRAYEDEKNARGDYADQAAASIARFRTDTQAHGHYAKGHLPPARVYLRAKRWAVKLFLSHWHEVVFFHAYGTLPPNPYPIAHLEHADRIAVPSIDLVPGLRAATDAVAPIRKAS